MIQYRKGDLLREPTEALVNTVNCVGVMGRGIALQFKKAFPKNYEAYREACGKGDVVPGSVFVFDRGALATPRYIVNFPTKRHWRGKSRIEDVETGLIALRREIEDREIGSIAIPPLGSGLGGLDWTQVRERIERALGDMDLDIFVFEPDGPPDASIMARTTNAPQMTAGRATLVILMRRYLDGLLDPTVTLLELHKLMYFMQRGGEDLRLDYRKYLYGPYADNLRHVLNHVEGHLVTGYADGGDDPKKELALIPGAYEDAVAYASENDGTEARIGRVEELTNGFETPFGLELLATVHWVVDREGADSVENAIERVYDWNIRKRRFTPRQIELAYDRLKRLGWFEVESSSEFAGG